MMKTMYTLSVNGGKLPSNHSLLVGLFSGYLLGLSSPTRGTTSRSRIELKTLQ